jgi:TPR repeat protein
MTPIKAFELAKARETGTPPWSKNLNRAFEGYNELADAGYPPALVKASYCLCHGIGTSINTAQAVNFAGKSLVSVLSQEEKAISFSVLGLGYATGFFEGINWTQNYDQAEHYLNLSYGFGLSLAGVFLGRYYFHLKNSDKAAAYMEKELDNLIRLANAGDGVAQCRLGSNYYQGLGVAKNNWEAFNLTLEAAMQKIPMAQFNLAMMYCEGSLFKKNRTEETKWLTMAAMGGETTAQMILGDYYKKGIGVTQDLAMARCWYAQAAGHSRIAREKLATFIQKLLPSAPAIEVLPSQVAFTRANDPSPVLATIGGQNCLAVAGYEGINKIAFLALLSSKSEVWIACRMILATISLLAEQKITKPIQVFVSCKDLTNVTKEICATIQGITAMSKVIPFQLFKERVFPTLSIDARSGYPMEYQSSTGKLAAVQSTSSYLNVVYRPS